MIKHTPPAHLFQGIGKCIYCWSVPSPPQRLTTEHVIPKSLGGLMQILDASCLSCADITKKFEQMTARGLFLLARQQLGIRQSKESPRTTTVNVERDGVHEDIEIDPSLWATGLLLPRFPGPQILTGTPPEPSTTKVQTEIRMWTRPDANLDAFNAKFGINGTPSTRVPVGMGAFSRMLAKIAYCGVVALGDMEGVTPLVLDYILGKEDVVFNHYVGCTFSDRPDRVADREIAIGKPHGSGLPGHKWSTEKVSVTMGTKKITFLVVRLQLFALFDTHSFDVVVGRYS